MRPHFCLPAFAPAAVGIGHVAGKDNANDNENENAVQCSAAGRHKSGFSQPGPQMFFKGFAVGAATTTIITWGSFGFVVAGNR